MVIKILGKKILEKYDPSELLIREDYYIKLIEPEYNILKKLIID
jgi:hypothetical protein